MVEAREQTGERRGVGVEGEREPDNRQKAKGGWGVEGKRLPEQRAKKREGVGWGKKTQKESA